MDDVDTQPKLPKSVLSIKGTRPDPQSNQLLISSGIPSLDEIIDGFPVGTIVMIEQDTDGHYSKVMLKYFLAEGLVSNHSTFIASQDLDVQNLVLKLPPAVAIDDEASKLSKSVDEKMKIAFRYQNLPSATSSKSKTMFGHNFDLEKTIGEDVIQNADIEYWNPSSDNVYYNDLLQQIRRKIQLGQFSLSNKPTRRNILRIGIHSLGSPAWLPENQRFDSNRQMELEKFMYRLRGAVRSAFAVAFITIPSQLLDQNTVNRCMHSSDVVIRLQQFAGTVLENNPVLGDYHGYLHLVKLAAINTFASKHPGSVEYSFKLRRRKFTIEMLHLPPDIQDEDKSGGSGMGCGSSSARHLEF